MLSFENRAKVHPLNMYIYGGFFWRYSPHFDNLTKLTREGNNNLFSTDQSRKLTVGQTLDPTLRLTARYPESWLCRSRINAIIGGTREINESDKALCMPPSRSTRLQPIKYIYIYIYIFPTLLYSIFTFATT